MNNDVAHTILASSVEGKPFDNDNCLFRGSPAVYSRRKVLSDTDDDGQAVVQIHSSSKRLRFGFGLHTGLTRAFYLHYIGNSATTPTLGAHTSKALASTKHTAQIHMLTQSSKHKNPKQIPSGLLAGRNIATELNSANPGSFSVTEGKKQSKAATTTSCTPTWCTQTPVVR